MPKSNFIALHGNHSSLVLDCSENAPAIAYWGNRLADNTDYAVMAELSKRQEAPASVEQEPHITLSPTPGEGFTGQLGLKVHRGAIAWGIYPQICDISQERDNEVTIISEDKHNHLMIFHFLSVDPQSDMISTHTKIKNLGSQAISVDWCAAPSFAIAEKYTDILSFEGRWAKEFQVQRHRRFSGVFLRENRKGRTSHDSFPGLILANPHADDMQGEALGFHLGWSGNHRLSVESLHDGRVQVQLGELLFPGEITLEKNDVYQSPTLYTTYSRSGLNGIAQNFHAFVRTHILSNTMRSKPRPVHFNTWEALYFDHDHDKLMKLVEEAANVGAERFVLDDGWFNGRRSDNAGLGDWYVDTSVYPEGLDPLINKVTAAGMEFGLWFEPEMVNPDSELFRQHPDWVLQLPNAPKIMARNQLVLDLTQDEVCTYLFERIDALLQRYNIAYIKWDMNRDIHQPANNYGVAAVHRQTLALYGLIEEIRAAHPELEIESCSSGGGRVDLGILRYTDRVWASDSNDALDRLSIQRGFSLFFPPEVMGAHVGPFDCHITGRKITTETRASTAFFGHMGMEVNLLEMADYEKSILKNAISLHKHYRELLHSGKLVRFDTNDYSDSFAVFSPCGKTAIYSYTDVQGHTTNQPSKFCFQGLDPKSHYEVNLIWPEAAIALVEWQKKFTGKIISGELLIENGIQLPLINPESSLIFKVENR